MLARYLRVQAAHFGHGIQFPVAVGHLAHIAVQAQHSGGRAGPYRVCRHRIGEVDVPLGPRLRALLPDARLYRLPVGLQIAALELQPANARHAQLASSDLHVIWDGEAILAGMLAFEGGVGALTLKEGGVGASARYFRTWRTDLKLYSCSQAYSGSRLRAVELLTQAEEAHLGLLADAVIPPAAVHVSLAGQKVIPHKPAGARDPGNSRIRTLRWTVSHCVTLGAAGMECKFPCL